MSPAQAALNSTPVHVVYSDGREEDLVLRQLSTRELYKFIDAVATDDVPRIVAFCMNQPIEWIDTLKIESYTKLAALAVEQNFPRAMVIIQGDPIAATKCARLLVQLDAARPQLKSLLDSLPAPVSSESAPVTSSESSTSPATA